MPNEAVRQIWQVVARRNSHLLIVPDASQLDWLTRLFPVGYTKMLRAQLKKL